MRLVSYVAGSAVRLGALVEGGVVDLEAAARRAGRTLPADMQAFIELGDAGLAVADAVLPGAVVTALRPDQLRAPLPALRKNVFCVGRNYREHLEEGARARGEARTAPEAVVFFSKAATSVIGPERAIEHDESATSQLDFEVELVIVIGTRGRNLEPARALDHVYGYTAGNDVSARDAQKTHLQWFKGKSMDTFCPLGPCIVPRRDLPRAQESAITLRVNGEVRQSSNTRMMMFDIPTIVAQLSRGLTLEPGDLIMTGTPAGTALGETPSRWLKAGDIVECEIEGIGVLRNPVRRYEG